MMWSRSQKQFAAVAKRQKLDFGRLPAVDVPSAQLADVADCLDLGEMRASHAACLLRQVHGLPRFSAVLKPPAPGMFV